MELFSFLVGPEFRTGRLCRGSDNKERRDIRGWEQSRSLGPNLDRVIPGLALGCMHLTRLHFCQHFAVFFPTAVLEHATSRLLPLILTSDECSPDYHGLRMRFFVTALAFALTLDSAMGECSTFQTQINVSMCNWQGLRGRDLSVSLL